MPTTATRRLRTAMLFAPGEFEEAVQGLSQRDIGGSILLASSWWSRGGSLTADGTELAGILGIRAAAAVELRDRVAPLFEPGGFYGLMRAAAVAKSERRARAGKRGNDRRWHGTVFAA